MRTLKPKIEIDTPFVEHNFPCPILGEKYHAVYNCNLGVFEPSLEAQEKGWITVRLPKWLKNFLLRRYRYKQ